MLHRITFQAPTQTSGLADARSVRGVDSSMFFHPDGERGRARAQRETRAKEMCRQCPVLMQCRSHALTVAEPYGIWGGMSETERELHARHRRTTRIAS